ncbi:sporulation membrane protein YtrI [Halobacillus sp. H74]|uniref:sporulation membrane protein YtrI n=1 Tax=Halobacillus sp. H74 TaxID=3457436 RepID=UPI003FCCB764
MHFPHYHKKKEWRRLFAGIVLGAVIGYAVFIYIHGELQEKYTEEHIEMTAKMSELEAKYEGLLNNQEQGTDQKPLTVTDLAVSYTNAKKLEVDLLTQHQLTTLVKDQLSTIPGKDITVIADQVDLMISTVENKNYVVDDFTYELKVTRLIVSEVITLNLEIKLVR